MPNPYTLRNYYDCPVCGDEWQDDADIERWMGCPHCNEGGHINPSCSEVIEIDGEPVTDRWVFLLKGHEARRDASGALVLHTNVSLSTDGGLNHRDKQDRAPFEAWCAERGITMQRIDSMAIDYIKPLAAPLDVEFKMVWL